MTQLECAERIAEDKSIDKCVRALIVLRICTLLRLQGKVDSEWTGRLRGLAKHLEPNDRATYESLGLGPEKQKRERGGFVANTVQRIEAARGLAEQDAARARNILLECEQDLAKKWWHWGRAPAWSTLLQTWSVMDRTEALRRIRRLSGKQRPKALHIWNRQRPLTNEEWTLVEEAMGARSQASPEAGKAPDVEAIDRLANAHGPMLPLLTALFFEEDAAVVHARLEHLLPIVGAAVDRMFLKDETGKQVADERQKGLTVFVRVMAVVSETRPETALTVALWACRQASGNEVFDQDFSFAFRQFIPVLLQAMKIAQGKQDVLSRLLDVVPDAYADFVQVQWHALHAKDPDGARESYASLLANARDKVNAARLYLVRLCECDLAETALSLARESTESADLMPRVQRAWLCTDIASARGNVAQDDFPDDKVVQLLLLPDAQARGAFLRRLTEDGTKDLPDDLWTVPGLSELMAAKAGTSETAGTGSVYGGFYAPVTEASKRFSEYVRLHSFGFLGNQTLDPLLLGGLVAWSEDCPDEVERLVRRMARKMQPDEELLTVDIVRSTAFTRCRAVLPAAPEQFLKHHVNWIKRTLVDDQLRIQVDANTVRVLSMPDRVLFPFALMGAENVAKFSFRLCEDIIARALKRYKTDAEFLPMAARLYASHAGLTKLDPPSPLPLQKRDWQKGVVAAAVPLIASEIIGQPGAAAAAEVDLATPEE